MFTETSFQYNSQSSTLTSLTMNEEINEFVESLKEAYRYNRLRDQERWPPVRGERLINLQLVEANKIEGFGGKTKNSRHNNKQPEDDKDKQHENDKDKRKSILHTDLFKIDSGKKPVRKIIVEGNAGIGKSTLCAMLAEGWAEGEILTQFDIIIILPLREPSVQSANSLSDLLQLFNVSEPAIINYVEKKIRKGLLIIADGWDELSEDKRSENSFLHKFLFGLFTCVVLTSRPSASTPIRRLMDRFVEVVGFDEKNIRQYIKADFEQDPEKASSLIEQLENNPLIQSVCSVPLSCAIVCDVWHKDQTLPSTITELYFRITRYVMLRDLNKKFPQYDVMALESFDSIPEKLQREFWLVCRFAYEFLSNDQIVFSDSEISKIASFSQDTKFSEKKSFFFGLLQTAHSILPGQSSVGYGLSFHFAHLTIQEFLAAVHIVTLSHEKKQKICDSYAGNDRFNVVWRFVLGLEGEKKYSGHFVSLGDVLVDQILFALRDEDMLLCHCSLESTADVVHCKVVNRICVKFSDDLYRSINTPLTAHDCVALLHIFESISHNCSEVKLNFSGSLNEKQLQKLATILIDKKLQVKELSLDNCQLTNECLMTFFKKASASFRHINEVSLDGNLVTDLPFSPSNNTVTWLSLSKNPLWECGVQSLERAVCAGSLVKLEYLLLSGALTNSTDIVDVTVLATLLPALATHCPNLNYLDLSKNNIGVPGAGAIGEALVKLAINRKELDLNLSETNLDSVAATAFSDKVLAMLVDVSNPLSCGIYLRVNKNPLGHSGLLAIFRMLSNKNCPVMRLVLDHTHAVNQGQLTTSSFETLTFPGQCSKLNDIYLQNNKPSGDTHIACLTMALKANIFGYLERLQLSETLPDNAEKNAGILTDLLTSIATHCPNLNNLDLSKNNIGVPGAGAIGEALVKFATNRKELKLNLSETNLDSVAATAFSNNVLAILVDVSNPLSCEIDLHVDTNPLGHSGLLAIFRMLSNKNCPVTRLHLDHTHAVNQGQLTASSFKTLTFPGQCSKLKSISLQNNKPSGDTHVACLTMAIKANIFGNLERLQLSETLPDNAEENAGLLTDLLTSIATHCPNLNDLDLSENNIGVPGAGAIGKALVKLAINRKELELNLSETNLNSVAATAFSDNVLAILADVSNQLSCEIVLHVDKNPLRHSGLLAIFRMLSNKNCPVTSLDLKSIIHTSITHLAPFSNNPLFTSLNSTITCLCLSGNLFHGENILILAEYIQCCVLLERLDCVECQLTSNDILILLLHLKSQDIQRTCLKRWNLIGNRIDDHIVETLTTHLPSVFPCIENIDLATPPAFFHFFYINNPVSQQAVETLQQFLKVRLML